MYLENHNVANEVHYQVLLAISEIRDYYTKNTVRLLYDDIGQLLSLVRVRLGVLSEEGIAVEKKEMAQLGEQTGEAIRTLRKLSSALQPENMLVENDNWIDSIQEIVSDYFVNAQLLLSDTRTSAAFIGVERLLLLFSIVLAVLSLIKKSCHNEVLHLNLYYSDEQIRLTLEYTGNQIIIAFLNDRIKILRATINQNNSENNFVKIELVVPLNK